MSEPRTKAGQHMWGHWNTEAMERFRWQHYLDDILAIEAESLDELRSRLDMIDKAAQKHPRRMVEITLETWRSITDLVVPRL